MKVGCALFVPSDEIDPEKYQNWEFTDEELVALALRQQAAAEQEGSPSPGKKILATNSADRAKTTESRSSTGVAVETVANKLVA